MQPKPKQDEAVSQTEDKKMTKNGNKPPALEVLIRQNRTVSTPTEDFSERTKGMSPDEFSREFDRSVSGKVGFGASVIKSTEKRNNRKAS